ncbi:MAG TPA: hypothetical protein VKA46_07355 [Gemmataceae bacterium]|nr:hypothetical protein [Gemmataceae bacterium]
MRIPDHPTLIRRCLDARLKKLATHTPILAASLVLARIALVRTHVTHRRRKAGQP